MPIIRTALTILFLCSALLANAEGQRRYVSPTLGGLGDASSWENASPHLQQVIDACHVGDTVWVAKGTYTGGFVMREGVTVIGGFEGSETHLEERRVALDADSLSVLSGGGKYRVLLQEKAFAIPTVWDGFMLTGGVASKGAGIWLREGGVMRNSLIEDNTAGKLSIGEMAEAEGGIVIAIAASKACILSMEEIGRNYQHERAKEVVGSYEGAGHADWRLPTAQELRALMPTSDAGYASFRLTSLALDASGASPLKGKRCWTSNSASSGGMAGAGCCDFLCMQYFPLNIYQYNKVRPVRECPRPEVEGAGAGVYAEGGCLANCLVQNNRGGTDIESTGTLLIVDSDEDAIRLPAATGPMRRVWRAGEVVELKGASFSALYNVFGKTVSKGTNRLQLPSVPGLYILRWQAGENISSMKISVIP